MNWRAWISSSEKDKREAASPLDALTRYQDKSMSIRGAQILRDLGVGKMKLLSNPRKMPSMTGFDLEVVGYQATPNH